MTEPTRRSPDGGTVSPQRVAELATALRALRNRIGAACERVGRDPEQLTLIAVTKTYPATDVLALARLGVRHVGENRDQEASAKRAEVMGHGEEPALSLAWHAIGQIQRNKARSVVQWADMVHSVDSIRLARALAKAAHAARTQPLRCLVQVSLDDEPGRGGIAVEAVEELAAQVDGSLGLMLGGVMAVAPLGGDPDAAFARLAEVADRVRQQYPNATDISAGMSADLEHAVRYGATHLRVGGAILGNRTLNP